MKEQKAKKISPELAVFMEHHHLTTVFLLLQIGNEELLQMDGFGWRLMKEVLRLRQV